MKKFFSVFLAIVLTLSLLPTVFASTTTETKLRFNLTCDNENVVTKKAHDTITVTYTLENVSDTNGNFEIETIANEIYYDHTFFEYMGEKENPLNQAITHQINFDKEHFVYVNTNAHPAVEYNAKQLVATLEFKILANSGSSTIRSVKRSASNGGESYKIDVADLTVNIGTSVAPTQYKLVFETNGGRAIGDLLKDAGTVIDLSDYTTERNGFSFEGWYLDAELKNRATNEITLDENTTVYAKWKELEHTTKYTLTFETNGGSSISAITGNDGDVVDLSSKTPTKSGYTFIGWYSDKALTHNVTSITLDSNKIVYAKWSKNSTGSIGGGVTKYTISFETNGGSEVDSTSKVRNTTVDLSKYITHKEGYSFDGWHTDKELTNKVTSIKVTANTTLYAKWVEGDNGYVDNPNYKPDIFASEHNAYIVGRDGGYIAPNENLTRAEAATIFFRLIDAQVRTEGMTKENTFTDVNEGDWFNTAVSTLANLEVLKGRSADTFAPNETITRAEFMTIVARLSEAAYNGEDIFSDTEGHWAEDYINIAASIKWANGDNGKFRPDDNVTRAEAMAIVNRATNRLPENTSDLLEGMETFIDNADVNAWYYLNIQEATNSHDFEMKADGVHEKWTTLRENPNWAEIER